MNQNMKQSDNKTLNRNETENVDNGENSSESNLPENGENSSETNSPENGENFSESNLPENGVNSPESNIAGFSELPFGYSPPGTFVNTTFSSSELDELNYIARQNIYFEQDF